jgi:hypothetical protein
MLRASKSRSEVRYPDWQCWLILRYWRVVKAWFDRQLAERNAKGYDPLAGNAKKASLPRIPHALYRLLYV